MESDACAPNKTEICMNAHLHAGKHNCPALKGLFRCSTGLRVETLASAVTLEDAGRRKRETSARVGAEE